MSKIESFLRTLQRQRNTPTVTNPYLDDGVVNNLRLYLEYMLEHMSAQSGRRVLLVGEAPGYKGCRITGIPFSSGKVLHNIDHPLFCAIRSQLSLSQVISENTATIVWQYLAARVSETNTVPLFWNSYPFHPHPKGNDQKNRAPNKQEIEQGVGYLQSLSAIFQPEVIAGVGAKGVECARKAYPEFSIEYIRHPSYGGKSEFIEGMDNII